MTIRRWLALALLGSATSLHGALYEGQVLVSDSGDRTVVAQAWEPGTYRVPSEPFLTIYDAGGAVIRTLEPTDLFTPSDIEALRLDRHSFELALRLDEGAGEVIAIALAKFATIRIRTSDGTLLDAPRDHFPAPRVYPAATREPAPRERFTATAEDACFDGVPRIASSQLFARAIERPNAVFPVVAMKARIRGRVWVELVVSESGEVACARATNLPFGLKEAALAAARQWKFTPYEVEGHPLPVTSEIVFHFEDLTPQRREELLRSSR